VNILRKNPERIWDEIPMGCAAFAQIVGFELECFHYENIASSIYLLNNLFTEFDSLCEEIGCDKIKSINNTFFAVTGLRRPGDDVHETGKIAAMKMAKLLIAMVNRTKKIVYEHTSNLVCPFSISIKIGAAQGPIISGVVGDDKFSFDCFGTTINEASRMASTCPPDHIQISERLKKTIEGLKTNLFIVPRKEMINVKGIGTIQTYFLSNQPTSDV
jgi:class 3 adenylate cyclase